MIQKADRYRDDHKIVWKSISSDKGLRQPDTTSGKPKSIAYRKDTEEIVTTKEPKSIEYREKIKRALRK